MQENFDEVISPYIKKTRVKEAVSHWSGKPFYIPWTTFNVWKATAILGHIDHIVSSTIISMQSMLMLGGWGMPPGKF